LRHPGRVQTRIASVPWASLPVPGGRAGE